MKQQKVTGYQPNYPRKVLKSAALTAAALMAVGSVLGCRQAKVSEPQIDGMVPVETPPWEELVLDGEVAIPEITEEPVIMGKIAVPDDEAFSEPGEEELVLDGDVIICEPDEEDLRTSGAIYVPEEDGQN